MGYVAPAMLVLIFLLVIPLFYTLYCSLYNLDYLVKGDFVGLGNYLRLLKDVRISKSLLFTFEITIISTLLSVGIGLLLALWVDREHGLFAYLIEMFGLIPWVISMMVAALLWRWLFNGDLGLFNMILKALGHNPIYVVENKNSAIIALIFVLTWRLVGYAMIMILAGLKSLDPVLLEAAKGGRRHALAAALAHQAAAHQDATPAVDHRPDRFQLHQQHRAEGPDQRRAERRHQRHHALPVQSRLPLLSVRHLCGAFHSHHADHLADHRAVYQSEQLQNLSRKGAYESHE